MTVDLKDWGPKDYPVRLRGHSLRSEGAAHSIPGCPDGRCWANAVGRPARTRWITDGTGGEGHALCSCGETSPHLPSGEKRKAWHRDHNRSIAPNVVDCEEEK